jgi:hypothetical protein
LVGFIPARVPTIEKMLQLDLDHIEYTYNDLSTALHRSFHPNPAIMLADMREPMQCNPRYVHSALQYSDQKSPLQTLNCRHRKHNIGPQQPKPQASPNPQNSTHVLPPHCTSSIPPQHPHIHNRNPHNGAQAGMAGHPPRPKRKACGEESGARVRSSPMLKLPHCL